MDCPIIKDSGKIARIILTAANKIRTGRIRLARFLKGSKSKIVDDISAENIYGGLYWLTIERIEDLIMQLEEQEFLEKHYVEGDMFIYPLLKPSKKGQDAILIDLPITLFERDIKKPIHINDSELETLNLFREGKTVEEVAGKRNLAVSTIYSHAYKLISQGMMLSSDIISEENIKAILDAAEKLGEIKGLKDIKETLPENISYEEIRCVMAEYRKENLR